MAWFSFTLLRKRASSTTGDYLNLAVIDEELDLTTMS